MFRNKRRRPQSAQPQIPASDDPLLTWITRVVAADRDFEAVCGPVDPEDLQALIHKRMMQFATCHLTRDTVGTEPPEE